MKTDSVTIETSIFTNEVERGKYQVVEVEMKTLTKKAINEPCVQEIARALGMKESEFVALVRQGVVIRTRGEVFTKDSTNEKIRLLEEFAKGNLNETDLKARLAAISDYVEVSADSRKEAIEKYKALTAKKK